MPDYENSTSFDTNLWSHSKNVSNAVDFIIDRVKSTKKITRWHLRYSDHIKLIILNLYKAYDFDPTMYVTYSRAKNNYTCQRYHGIDLRYEAMVQMVNILTEDLGYIEGVKGFYYPQQGKARAARMKATGCLIEEVFRRFHLISCNLERNPKEEIIILKDEKKNKIDYDETKDTTAMRTNLSIINNIISSHFIGLCIADSQIRKIDNELRSKKCDYKHNYKGPLDFSRIKLKRIFNNRSFSEGGRFYGGWWQGIPSKYRQYIRIDNKMTREIDFSGLHINLLYAVKGLPIPTDDVYTIPGLPAPCRPFLKVALQVMLNSDNEQKALWTLKRKVYDGEVPREITMNNLNEIIDAFKAKHSAIEENFYKGAGVKLQFIDSEIAEDVLLRLHASGIPALPVHDSFIVKSDDEATLFDVMNHSLLMRFDQNFGLKKQPTAYETDRPILLENLPQEDVPSSVVEYEDDWPLSHLIYNNLFEQWRKKHSNIKVS